MKCLEKKIKRTELLLVFHRKDLCEARVNFEVCSYLADEPSLANGPPSQLSMDLWKTITPNNFHDRQTLALPPPIIYRSMEDHYTAYFWLLDPLQLSMDLWKTVTSNNFHDRLTLALPPPIDHRSMEDHYTAYFWLMDPLQLSMDLWKTITPYNFHDRLTSAPCSNQP